MSEVIIKGELHTSRADLEAERDLLAEGVNTLVIEGSRDDADYGWLHSWFGVAMLIFEHLFASFLYTDSQVLVDIAKGQNAEVVYTRDTDAALLTNSHHVVVLLAFLLFYACLLLSAVFGVVFSDILAGASLLLLSGLGPILLLRLHETSRTRGNRDQLIADIIAEAANEDDRVVAVMGAAHAQIVPDHLPDDLDPVVNDPCYGRFSLPMLRDIAGPTLRLCGTLSLVYPAFLWITKLYLTFL